MFDKLGVYIGANDSYYISYWSKNQLVCQSSLKTGDLLALYCKHDGWSGATRPFIARYEWLITDARFIRKIKVLKNRSTNILLDHFSNIHRDAVKILHDRDEIIKALTFERVLSKESKAFIKEYFPK